jgi:tetratricopeptide (TPR) repeat protein
MRPWRLSVVTACAVLGPAQADAKFAAVDVERVPVARLIRNLEAEVEKKPNDVRLLYALARVHSMAYAQRVDALDVDKAGRPFFGYGDQGLVQPQNVQPAQDARSEREAKEHLAQAISRYRQAVAINPANTLAQIGLGWCLDQAGDVPAALRAYRMALAQAWDREHKAEDLPGAALTGEIAGYMLKRLDPKKDAMEIARIREYEKELQKKLQKKPRWMTPILVPLGGALPLELLVDSRAKVAFDLDGTGARPWGWITPEAGWLVYDHDGSGRITSGLQMVGNVSFWVLWNNGYDALAALDDDGDGRLAGEELAGLGIWRDANTNGVSEPGEVRPVGAWGITALSCRYDEHRTGIPFSPRGAQFQDGTTRPTYDWIVHTR